MNIKHLLISLLVNGLLIYVAANVLPNVRVDGFWAAIMVAGVFALVNNLVKPIVSALALPITVVTLGLFTFVINGLMVLLTDWLLQGFEVSSFLMAIVFGVVLSVTNTIAGSFSLN
jgi:putative membrane protein